MVALPPTQPSSPSPFRPSSRSCPFLPPCLQWSLRPTQTYTSTVKHKNVVNIITSMVHPRHAIGEALLTPSSPPPLPPPLLPPPPSPLPPLPPAPAAPARAAAHPPSPPRPSEPRARRGSRARSSRLRGAGQPRYAPARRGSPLADGGRARGPPQRQSPRRLLMNGTKRGDRVVSRVSQAEENSPNRIVKRERITIDRRII